MLTVSREYPLKVGNIHFKWGIFTSSREYSLQLGNIHFNWGIFTSSGEYSLQVGDIHLQQVKGEFAGLPRVRSKGRRPFRGWREAHPLVLPCSKYYISHLCSCHIQNITSHTYVPAIFKISHLTQSGPAIFKILHQTLMVLPYSKYFIS